MNILSWFVIMVVAAFFLVKFYAEKRSAVWIFVVIFLLSIIILSRGLRSPLKLVGESEASSMSYEVKNYEELGENCFLIQTKDEIRFRCTDGSEKRIQTKNNDLNIHYTCSDNAIVVVKDVRSIYEINTFLLTDSIVEKKIDMEVYLPQDSYIQYAYNMR